MITCLAPPLVISLLLCSVEVLPAVLAEIVAVLGAANLWLRDAEGLAQLGLALHGAHSHGQLGPQEPEVLMEEPVVADVLLVGLEVGGPVIGQLALAADVRGVS